MKSAAAPISCCPSVCARAPTSTTSRASRRRRRSTPTSTTRRATPRAFGGNVVGAWGTYSLNATMDHSEYFYNLTDSVLSGSLAAHLVHAQRAADRRLARLLFDEHRVPQLAARPTAEDRQPTAARRSRPGHRPEPHRLRAADPLSRSRNGRGSRSTPPSAGATPTTRAATSRPAIRTSRPTKVIDVGLNRTLYTLQAQIVGPVFNRIWDTPENGYAEKFKHSIEPVLTVNRTSSVDNFNEIVKLDGIDNIIGGTTTHLRPQQPLLREAQGDAGRARRSRARSSTSSCHRATTPTRTRRSTTRSTRPRWAQAAPPTQLLADRAELPRAADRRDQRQRCAPSSTRAITRCARSRHRASYIVDHSRAGHRRLEQARLHRGDPGVQRLPPRADPRPACRPRSIRRSTRLDTMHTKDNKVGATLLVQLRHPARLRCSSSACRCSTTRSAAASRSSTRPTTTAPASSSPDSRRPSLLPVVHARRPRQLLALQRRAERRPALADAIRDVDRHSGHRRRGIRGQPSDRSAGRLRRERDRLAPPGRLAAARRRRRRAGRRSICSIRRRCRPPSIARGRRPCITAPAPRTSGAPGTRPRRPSRPTCWAPIMSCRRSSGPALEARVLVPSSALVYASADEALTEDASAPAVEPVRR